MITCGDWAPVGFSFGPDWAIDLWDGVCWGLLAGGSGPKPMVSTMPPFSRLGRLFVPSQEKRISGTCLMWGVAGKKNIWNLLDMGIGEVLMQGCSNVHITKEFVSFLTSHLMRLFGDSFEAGDLYKRFAWGGIFCANGYHWFL